MIEITDHSFFNFFPVDLAHAMAAEFTIERPRPDTVLFDEGDPPDLMYLVLEGEIRLSKRTVQGQYVTIATVEADDYFGEFGIVDNLGRSARAVTDLRVVVATIPIDVARRYVQMAPGSALLGMTRKIANEVRQTNRMVLDEVVRKEKLSLIGEMANSVIHDFKGPMASIRLGSELLEQDCSEQERQELTGMIRTQVDRMSGMATELLEYAKGVNTCIMTPLPLQSLFDALVRCNQVYLDSLSIELIAQPTNLNIRGDAGKVGRLLQNLINNSAEAMPDGGEITLRATLDGKLAEIQIEDTGPGVPEEIRDTLFEPFVSHGKTHGTGLGMAIAKSVAESHGGTIELAEGAGACFVIQLPAVVDG